ncbi:DUF6185 family protein [Streptomyces sp. NPDC004237]|uniref:DUF6185 family protein n=1 Tax=Streptomyces sp. NPDC004237 TaxID=3154455 RepID=UPI0033B36F05
MGKIRWWWLLPLVAAVAWWGSFPAEAREDSHQDCLKDQLRHSSVNAEIQFFQRRQNYVKVYSRMTVSVPRKWTLARNLTFSEESEEYHRAMHCLLLGPKGISSNEEYRPYNPKVVAEGKRVTVHYDAFLWVQKYGTIRLGPWKISGNKQTNWRVALDPQSLSDSPWHVTARLDGLNFNDQSKPEASYADGNKLEWKREMPSQVAFDVDLPWQHSLALVFGQSWQTAGVAAWWVCASCVIVLAALRTQRPHASTATNTAARSGWRMADAHGNSPVRTMLQWGLLSVAVALALLLIIPQQHTLSLRWRSLLSLPAGLALILAARPWRGGPSPVAPDTKADRADNPDAAQRRRARIVIACASGVTAAGLLVVVAPALFGLPEHLVSKGAPTVSGITGLALMGLATVWLWLAAMVAWAWRFAREGGLASVSWTRKWDTSPGRCTAVTAAVLAVAAGALLACAWAAAEHRWNSTNWLSSSSVSYSATPQFNKFMATFSFTDLLWIYSYSWILTAISLAALLYFHVRAQRAEPDGRKEELSFRPGTPDLLLIAALFAFLVGLQGRNFANVAALYGIWIPLNIFSLYAIVTLGRRWSVIGRLGDHFYERLLSSKKHRRELLAKAQLYRSLNHELYLLDQGHGGSVTRQQLEDKLRGLHQWLIDECGGERPPEHLSVLDVALAWGPQGHWWPNALRAARLAFCFGVPASAALVFLDSEDTYKFLQISYEPTGIPDVVANFFTYQMAWAGAGFVLGALWRLLPGHRSPARAWSLTIAYALPICIAVLIKWFTDAPFGQVFLYALLMLSILTLTSICMDLATFRREQELWTSRFALLLSIYQVRGFSTQIAWLLTQLVAVVTLYQRLFHD